MGLYTQLARTLQEAHAVQRTAGTSDADNQPARAVCHVNVLSSVR
jgi:hypothetical protein